MTVIEQRWPWLAGLAPLPGVATTGDPLRFPGYTTALKHARTRSAVEESVTCALASIDGHSVVAAVFSFEFLGGSMGEAAGRRLVQAVETAGRNAFLSSHWPPPGEREYRKG